MDIISKKSIKGYISSKNNLQGFLRIREIIPCTCSFDANTQDATAENNDILDGKTAYVKANKVIGTMTNNKSVTGIISIKDEKYNIPEGYHNGLGTVSIGSEEQDKIISENIRNGVTILGVKGNVVPSSGEIVEKDINFYDYDGTLLYSYTLEDIQTLEELPKLPSQKGLICQGWNWTLEEIKNENSKVNVGATYITDDGKTRIYIHLEERRSPILGLLIKGTVIVDWGDGETSTITNIDSFNWKLVYTSEHTYANSGDYIITLEVNGSASISGNSYCTYILRSANDSHTNHYVYANTIKKIEIGNNISLSDYAFNNCYSLLTITIPNGITKINSYAFHYCYSLSSISIPSGVTSLYVETFYYCYSLLTVSLPSSVILIDQRAFYYCYCLKNINIPYGITKIYESVFQNCISLLSILIPSSVTSIDKYAFGYCYSLENITLQFGITNIRDYAFVSCYSLKNISIPESVTNIGNYIFSNCTTISNVAFSSSVISTNFSGIFNYCNIIKNVNIPYGVTKIGSNCFDHCYSLLTITIPDGVTNIGASAFNYCQSLSSISIPSSVTVIGSNAFCYCTGILYYDFTNHTSIPSLAGTNAFSGINSDCQIRVPESLLDEWKAATNWSRYAKYMVGV